jgi:hypothetical protein
VEAYVRYWPKADILRLRSSGRFRGKSRHQQWHDARLVKEEGMNDDRTKADKAWEARQEAARYRIFNAATNAAEATDEADADENYFAVLELSKYQETLSGV